VDKKTKAKLIICCIPLSWDFVPKDFFYSWCKMTGYANGKYDFGVMISSCCYMDKMREDLVRDALKYNPDYILWIDADQIYPMQTPEILMKHIDDGKLVVGGLTPDKVDGTPLIYKTVDKSNGLIRRRTDVKPGQGLVKVGAMGMGGIMVSPKVFEKIKSPYFEMSWSDRTKDVIGEDVRFYMNCEKFGIDVWCDTNLVYEHLIVKPMKLAGLENLNIAQPGLKRKRY